MDEYIEKQAAIEKIHSEFDECLVWDESGKHTADEVERILDTIPPADVRPTVEILNAVDEAIIFLNNVSRQMPYHVYSSLYYLIYKICPNCGADMRGGDADG